LKDSDKSHVEKLKCAPKNRLLFIDTGDTGKTRPHTTSGPRCTVTLYYSCVIYNSVVLLSSLPFHRLLGSPGLAKLTPGSTALPGVPTRLGTLLWPSSARKNDASNSCGSDVSTLRGESKGAGRRDFAV
jgi:hypothetical protein